METDTYDKQAAGEKAFKKWLDQEGIRFFYIDQTPDTFSEEIAKDAKRPDFILLDETIGFITVDVKNKSSYKDDHLGQVLTLDENDYKCGACFERSTKVSLWYAYFDEENNKWLWIDSKSASIDGFIKENTNDKRKTFFYSIPIDKLSTVNSKEDLIKLVD
jgi:hypothetical protein